MGRGSMASKYSSKQSDPSSYGEICRDGIHGHDIKYGTTTVLRWFPHLAQDGQHRGLERVRRRALECHASGVRVPADRCNPRDTSNDDQIFEFYIEPSCYFVFGLQLILSAHAQSRGAYSFGNRYWRVLIICPILIYAPLHVGI